MIDLNEVIDGNEITKGYLNNLEQVGATNELNEIFLVVKSMNAKFGKDGNQWYYIVGELPEPDCIVGFGDTPQKALYEFYDAWKGKSNYHVKRGDSIKKEK